MVLFENWTLTYFSQQLLCNLFIFDIPHLRYDIVPSVTIESQQGKLRKLLYSVNDLSSIFSNFLLTFKRKRGSALAIKRELLQYLKTARNSKMKHKNK